MSVDFSVAVVAMLPAVHAHVLGTARTSVKVLYPAGPRDSRKGSNSIFGAAKPGARTLASATVALSFAALCMIFGTCPSPSEEGFAILSFECFCTSAKYTKQKFALSMAGIVIIDIAS